MTTRFFPLPHALFFAAARQRGGSAPCPAAWLPSAAALPLAARRGLPPRRQRLARRKGLLSEELPWTTAAAMDDRCTVNPATIADASGFRRCTKLWRTWWLEESGRDERTTANFVVDAKPATMAESLSSGGR
jgi:hypothetical protein